MTTRHVRRALTATLLIGTFVVPTGSAGTALASGPRARAACSRDVPATIGGQHKCLGAGEYCARRYERQYERHGFICSTRYDPPRLRRK